MQSLVVISLSFFSYRKKSVRGPFRPPPPSSIEPQVNDENGPQTIVDLGWRRIVCWYGETIVCYQNRSSNVVQLPVFPGAVLLICAPAVCQGRVRQAGVDGRAVGAAGAPALHDRPVDLLVLPLVLQVHPPGTRVRHRGEALPDPPLHGHITDAV